VAHVLALEQVEVAAAHVVVHRLHEAHVGLLVHALVQHGLHGLHALLQHGQLPLLVGLEGRHVLEQRGAPQAELGGGG
jgi:hypothetical protein